jgi:hypothetical protein
MVKGQQHRSKNDLDSSRGDLQQKLRNAFLKGYGIKKTVDEFRKVVFLRSSLGILWEYSKEYLTKSCCCTFSISFICWTEMNPLKSTPSTTSTIRMISEVEIDPPKTKLMMLWIPSGSESWTIPLRMA